MFLFFTGLTGLKSSLSLSLKERGAIKGNAMGVGKEFSSFPSPPALPSDTLLAFRPPRTIQIERTGDESVHSFVIFTVIWKGKFSYR